MYAGDFGSFLAHKGTKLLRYIQLAFSLECSPFLREHLPALFSTVRDITVLLQTPSPFRSRARTLVHLFVSWMYSMLCGGFPYAVAVAAACCALA